MTDCLSKLPLCKRSSSPAQRSQQLIQHTGAFLLVGASATLGSYFGYLVGSQQHVLIGLVFAAAALGGEIIKPYAVSEIVNALAQWNVIRALACLLLASVCIIYSFTAELSLAATTRGDLAASREAVADAARDARSDRQRAETELATLQPAKSVVELQAEIDGLLLDPKTKGCTKIDSPTQERFCPRVAALKIEKARAERRAELEATLVSAARPISEHKAVLDADPLAGAVIAYAQVTGYRLDSTKLLPWLALVPVLFLELGSALAVVVVRGVGPAVSPVNSDTVGSDTAALDHPALQAGSVVQKRSKPKRKDRRPPSGPGSAGPPARGLAGTLKVLKGGAVQGSQRAIAAAIGTSKTTVQRAMRLLEQSPNFAAA